MYLKNRIFLSVLNVLFNKKNDSVLLLCARTRLELAKGRTELVWFTGVFCKWFGQSIQSHSPRNCCCQCPLEASNPNSERWRIQTHRTTCPSATLTSLSRSGLLVFEGSLNEFCGYCPYFCLLLPLRRIWL